jgi:fluoroacetyl-CoA thioesterase
MKSGLSLGNQYEFSIEVLQNMQAQFEDTVIHPLYSTAAMINHMEWAARQHILPYLEAGEEGVGYQVDVKHLAPAPIGAKVTIRSTVNKITHHKVTSHVEAWYGQLKIGNGQITQAIVPLNKIYDKSDPNNETGITQASDAPPPAELTSTDGQSQLQLEILKWETGILPCTRYDEWLICKVSLIANGFSSQEEGPFLLRHEIEDWLTISRQMMLDDQSGFRSDFLEPVLKIEIKSAGADIWDCILNLNAPSKGKHSHPDNKIQIDRTAFQRFLTQLETQLEGFPSRL